MKQMTTGVIDFLCAFAAAAAFAAEPAVWGTQGCDPNLAHEVWATAGIDAALCVHLGCGQPANTH